MARPKTYPTFYCPLCQVALKRHKDIYHDCVGCGGHYKVVEGEIMEIPKRLLKDKVIVSRGMDADEYERLAG